jgi:glycosyltransferase involved in cell wall biosynthesis
LLAQWLEKRGYEVRVLCNRGCCPDGKHIRTEGFLPLDHYAALPSLSEVERVIREIKPDVVHVHHLFAPLSALAAAACSKLGVPRVLTNHSLPPVGGVKAWAKVSYVTPYRWLLKPTVATAVSAAAAQFAREFFGWRDVKVIPNAVDCSKFKPRSLEEREDWVLYVGRLVWRKGVHVLVKAAEILEERFRCRVLIAGEGYLERYLRLLSSDLRSVELVGGVGEQRKVELYSKAKLLALPSLGGESFGVVFIEAFASATPVVASRVGGIPEVVDSGINGLLVDPGNPVQLAVAIGEVLSDDNLWRTLSRNARKKAVEKYSIEVVGKLYERAYQEALELEAATERAALHNIYGGTL